MTDIISYPSAQQSICITIRNICLVSDKVPVKYWGYFGTSCGKGTKYIIEIKIFGQSMNCIIKLFQSGFFSHYVFLHLLFFFIPFLLNMLWKSVDIYHDFFFFIVFSFYHTDTHNTLLHTSTYTCLLFGYNKYRLHGLCFKCRNTNFRVHNGKLNSWAHSPLTANGFVAICSSLVAKSGPTGAEHVARSQLDSNVLLLIQLVIIKIMRNPV